MYNNPETNIVSLTFNAIANHYAAIVAVMLVTACILWLTHHPVPDPLEKLTLIVALFFVWQGLFKK